MVNLILKDLPSPSTVYSAYASLSASVMLLRTTFQQIFPHPLQEFLRSSIFRIFNHKNTSCFTLVVDQFDGMSRNDLFDSFEIYLSTKTNSSINCLNISKSSKDKHLTLKLVKSETVVDFFQGIKIEWKFVCQEIEGPRNPKDSNGLRVYDNQPKTKCLFELQFNKIHKKTIIDLYIPFVLGEAKAIREENKAVKLHTLTSNAYFGEAPIWDSISLEHSATFEKLAMEPNEKKAVMDDLDLFVQRKEYYKRVGRAWKRGYLLYGPPGAGKSSFIAAIANYLKFDIYDLQLMNVKSDSALRKLMLSTANRSILVIEDIDCSVEIPDRKTKSSSSKQNPKDLQFTLSGLLNFIDGLWSSCGDERIIIFTTNNKDKLDPALLRPGRMDMHVHMSYLTMNGFKTLASNYLDIKDGKHFEYREIEELIESVEVTPAEVAEELMKTNDEDVYLRGVVNFLKRKRMLSLEEKKKIEDGVDIDTTDGSLELPKAKRIKANGLQ